MPDLSGFARRLVPARGDVAASRLRGLVEAERYSEGEVRAVHAPLADLLEGPGSGLATQLLHGEVFVVHAEADGLAWGQAEADGYVGHVESRHLGPPVAGPGRVTALWAQVYPEPSIKRRPLTALPFMARVAAASPKDGFRALAGGGHLCAQHVDAPARGDFVDEAMRLLGASYLWGGRSPGGLDCSALVQLALAAVGVAAPRDSDMQEAMVGHPLGREEEPRRGDLVFWRGHVGIMTDRHTLLHANAHAMAVTLEPLDRVAERVAAAGGGPITARRRGAETEADWLPPIVRGSAGS